MIEIDGDEERDYFYAGDPEYHDGHDLIHRVRVERFLQDLNGPIDMDAFFLVRFILHCGNGPAIGKGQFRYA